MRMLTLSTRGTSDRANTLCRMRVRCSTLSCAPPAMRRARYCPAHPAGGPAADGPDRRSGRCPARSWAAPAAWPCPDRADPHAGLDPWSGCDRLSVALAVCSYPARADLARGLLPAPILIGFRLRLLLGLALLALTLLTLALVALALARGLLLRAIGLRLRLLALIARALVALRVILALRHSLLRLAFTTRRAARRSLVLGRTFLLAAAAARHVLSGRKYEAAQKRRRGGADE